VSTKHVKHEMLGTEAELIAMTRELEEMHQATMPIARQHLLEAGRSLKLDRRRILVGAGIASGGVLLAACGSSSKSSSAGATSSTAPAQTSAAGTSSGGDSGGDTAGLRLNASLENLAVFAYGATLTAAGKGQFGTVPASVAGFASNTMKQHAEHAQAFNAALVKAGGKAYTDPDPALKQTVLDAFGKTKSVPDIAKLALLLENTAGHTYTKQFGEFDSAEAVAALATIQPVERQHAAILQFILGEYPVPETFVPTTLARPSSDVPAP
jgi:hypothetical protein